MPYLSEKIKIQGTDLDRRKRVDDFTKSCIKYEREHDGTSYNKLAKKYGCSKRLCMFICNPEMQEKARADFKERRKDGRYYVKEKQTVAIRETRRYKQHLKITGKIKQNDARHEINPIKTV